MAQANCVSIFTTGWMKFKCNTICFQHGNMIFLYTVTVQFVLLNVNNCVLQSEKGKVSLSLLIIFNVALHNAVEVEKDWKGECDSTNHFLG